jgi:hypothetical protein
MGRIYTFDVVPLTANVANICASSTPAAAGSLALLTTSTLGGKYITRSDGIPVVQLDCPRAVSVTLAASGTPTTITVTGYDQYGQRMSEILTSVANATTAMKKAFYQISGVTTSAATAQAISIGTSQLIGLPVRVTNGVYLAHVGWNSGFALDTGNLAVADTLTATTSTGDVRGTFSPTNAPDGIKRLCLGIMLPAIAAGPNATRIGGFGVNQNLVV